MSDQVWLTLIKDFPWAALITAISTITAGFLTAYMTGRRSKRERLWELQREAFGEIISSVREGERLVVRMAELSGAARIDGNFATEEAALKQEWIESSNAARRRAARDGLILPDDFNEAYNRMAKAMGKVDGKRPPVEVALEAQAILEGARRDLETIARAHLKRRA